MTMIWAAIISANVVHGRRGSSGGAECAGVRAEWADIVPPRERGGWSVPRSRPGSSLTPGKSPGFVPRPRYGRPVLAGRDVERGAIAALLDAARAGNGGALVVRGVAGSGKSSLLAEALPADMTVLRTS